MSALPVPVTRGAAIPFAVPTTPVVNPALPSFGPYIQAADSKGRHTVVNDDFHLFGTHGHGFGYKYPHGGYAGYLSEYGVPPGATVMAGEQYAPQAPVLVGRPHGAGYYYPQGSTGYGEGFGQAYGHGVSYPYGHGHTWPYYYPQNYTHGGIFGAGPQPYPHHHTSYHSGQRHSRYQGGQLVGN